MRNEDVFNNETNTCACGCEMDINGVVNHVEGCKCDEEHHFEETCECGCVKDSHGNIHHSEDCHCDENNCFEDTDECCDVDHEHGDSCGCGHDHSDEDFEVDLEPIYITFEGEDGDSFELECGVIGVFDTDDNSYIAVLIPEVEDEFEEGVYYFRYEEDEEGNPLLDEIETDEEFEKVHEVFEDIYYI